MPLAAVAGAVAPTLRPWLSAGTFDDFAGCGVLGVRDWALDGIHVGVWGLESVGFMSVDVAVEGFGVVGVTGSYKAAYMGLRHRI